MSRGIRLRGVGWLAALLAMVAGCSSSSIEIPRGQSRSGDIKVSVGRITLGEDCHLDGGITLRTGNVTIGDRSIVSGPVEVGDGNVVLGANVQAPAVAVGDGSMTLGEGTRIRDSLELNDGLLEVRGARIEGPIKLKRGRLEIGAGSEITGGVHVENSGHTPLDSTYVVVRAGAHLLGMVSTRGPVRVIVEAAVDTSRVEFVGNQPEFFTENPAAGATGAPWR